MTLEQVALTFGGMEPAREVVYEQLIRFSSGGAKTGMREEHLRQNLEFRTSPLMPALDRYSGTLYDALHGRGLKGTPTEHNSLGALERKRAAESVFIQSALFGLIPATNLIPNYRFSAGSKLPGFDLKKHWASAHEVIWKRLEGNLIIDLRSKAYAELAPIPESLSHFWVEVVAESEQGHRRALNHFNKKAKGEFVRSVLSQTRRAETLADLKVAAETVGLRLEESKAQLTLVSKE